MTENTNILTGVLTANKIAFLGDVIIEAIDIDFEQYVRAGGDPDLYESDNATYLVGYVYNEETGLYEEDHSADYCAIISEVYVQVTYSKYYALSAMCSPCFPMQGDPETSGPNAAYVLPEDLYEDNECPYTALEVKVNWAK